MSHDGMILASLLLSACITGVCTVLASLATVRGAKRARMRAEKERLSGAGHGAAQSLGAHIQLWKKVAFSVLVTVFLVLALIVQVVSLSKITPYPGREKHAASTEWRERVQSEDWYKWRKQVHEKLSATPVSETSLAEALSSDLPRITKRDDLPDILRRDQAIADVLLSYPEVSEILKNRLGIRRETFLGTGFSKPATDDVRIASVSVHEYLIPNYPEAHDKVWAWQVKPVNDDFLKKPIREIVGGNSAKDVTPILPTNVKDGDRKTVQEILDRITPDKKKEYKSTPAVIRFGQFPIEDYKGTLGYPGGPARPKALRVFASNLAEVWDQPLKDAATLSGYIPRGGSKDTFFIWIFLPDHQGEVVPATWGRILDNLPKWLEDNNL